MTAAPPENEVDIWDESISAVSGENVDYPYIVFPKEADWRGYKLPLLKWGKDEPESQPQILGMEKGPYNQNFKNNNKTLYLKKKWFRRGTEE
jgi:hypothetical protein